MSPMFTTSASLRGFDQPPGAALEHLEPRLLVLQQQGDRTGVGVVVHAEMSAEGKVDLGSFGVGHLG